MVFCVVFNLPISSPPSILPKQQFYSIVTSCLRVGRRENVGICCCCLHMRVGEGRLSAGLAPESGEEVFQVTSSRALGGCCCSPCQPSQVPGEGCKFYCQMIFCVCVCAFAHMWRVSFLMFISCLVDISFCFAERRVLEENWNYRIWRNYAFYMPWLLLY